MSPQTWGSPPSCPRVTARIVCSELISGTVETRKIDPLNRKQYGAVSAALTVTDVAAAVSFYQKAFGFAKRGIMKGPDGKPVHAELTLRGTTLMLGPESPAMGRRSAKSIGASPDSLYIYVENVDKVVEKATKLGATPQGRDLLLMHGGICSKRTYAPWTCPLKAMLALAA